MTKSPGISKTMSIGVMLVVIGCFAFLWPTIFYPMILCGLNWNNEAKYSWEGATHEQLLPPKVREAMRSSPLRESTKVQKLPGRPQFYAGPRDVRPEKGTTQQQQGSTLNLLMPLYSIIIIVLFMYIIFKTTFNSNEEDPTTFVPPGLNRQHNHQSNSSQSCRECNQMGLGSFPYPQAPNRIQRNRDLLMMRSSYRALSYLGKGNPVKSMHNLIQDMETFRNFLAVAQVCQCKMKKFEMATKATENCVNAAREKSKEEDESETRPDVEEEEEVQEVQETETLNNTELDTEPAHKKGTTEEEQHKFTESLQEEVAENTEQQCNKENADLPDHQTARNLPSGKEKMKRRKRKTKLCRVENMLANEETAESICTKFHNTFDAHLLDKWNQEMDRLANSESHLKNE